MERKICEILVRGSKYDLVDAPDKTHQLGKLNGRPDTLWVKITDEPLSDGVDYVPWIDIGTNRKSWNIQIRQDNSVKYKWDEHRIDGYTNVIIKLNNDQVYEFICNDLNYAFINAQHIIKKLEDFPIDISNMKDELINRKIYYKSQPAKVTAYFDDGTIRIKPDCKKDYLDTWWDNMIEPWHESYNVEHYEECKDDGSMIVNLFSEYIYWWRNDRKDKLNKIKKKMNE